MKKTWSKSIFSELSVIAFLSLTPMLWFRPGQTLVGHDNTYPLSPVEFVTNRLYTWTQSSLGYDQSLIMGTLPIHVFDILGHFLGLSLQSGQILVYFLWFFVIGISVWVLARVLEMSPWSRILMVVMYQFNFFLLQAWWVGEKSKFSAYCTLPLLLALYLSVYHHRLTVRRGIVLSGFVLFVFNAGGIFGIPLYGGLMIVLSVFILFFSIRSVVENNASQALRLWVLLTGTIGMYIVMNSYFLFPALTKIRSSYQAGVAGSGGVSNILDWTREVSKYTSYFNLIRLQGIPDWYDNIDHPYAPQFLTNNLLVTVSFLWPILILVSLIFIKNHKRPSLILYFFLVYLVGILFASGTHPPFGFLYEWLEIHVPGFVIFRTPYYKFAPAVFLAASFLIAILIDYIKGYGKIVLTTIGIGVILGYHYPFFTGDFFTFRAGMSTRLSVPTYVTQFYLWASELNHDGYRTLVLPPNNERWGYELYSWKYLSLTPLAEMFGSTGSVGNDIRLNEQQTAFIRVLYQRIALDDIATVLRIARVFRLKYFLIRNDYAWNLYWAQTVDPAVFTKFFQIHKEFSKLRSFGAWDVYQLSLEMPDMFSANDAMGELIASKETQQLTRFISSPAFTGDDFIIRNFTDPQRQHLSRQRSDQSYQAVVPECINCRYFTPPVINFPIRTIIPESILYPLIRLGEDKQLKKQRIPSEKVYTLLGFTLKRIGELKNIVDNTKPGKDIVLKSLDEEYRQMDEIFSSVTDPQKKVRIASELTYYLNVEKQYLENFYGRSIVGEYEVALLQKVLLIIDKLLNSMAPYSQSEQITLSRLYSFGIPTPGQHEVLLRSDALMGDSQKDIGAGQNGNRQRLVTIVIDKNHREAMPSAVNDYWVSLGTLPLTEGNHTLTLPSPDQSDALTSFVPSEKQLDQKNCFVSPVVNFKSDALYRLEMSITDESLLDILVFVKKVTEDGETVESTFSPFLYSEKRSFLGRVEELKGVRDVSLTVCGKNLKVEHFGNTMHTRLMSIFEQPLMLVHPAKETVPYAHVSFQKINPTRYVVDVPESHPKFLVFTQAYDPNWKLYAFSQDSKPWDRLFGLWQGSGFDKNHFIVNAYMNGWDISGTKEKRFIVEYFPQRLFYVGIMVSLISCFIAGILLFRKEKKP